LPDKFQNKFNAEDILRFKLTPPMAKWISLGRRKHWLRFFWLSGTVVKKEREKLETRVVTPSIWIAYIATKQVLSAPKLSSTNNYCRLTSR